MRKERNQTFTYLYVLAILMVLDDHTCTRINILTSVFPYNSFYMPLFVFISGYFYRHMNFIETVQHRTKRIMIPYIIYDCAMIIIAYTIDRLFHFHWYPGVSWTSVVHMLFEAPTTQLNGAAWFAVMLFWVSVIYSFMRIFFNPNRTADGALTVLLLLLGFAGIYTSMHCYEAFGDAWPVIRWGCKTAFFLQFYHFGYLFKTYFETSVQKWNRLYVCLGCFLVNLILTVIYGDKINFISIVHMRSFHSTVLPLITSFSGILFYYEVMGFLAEKIGETKITSFISRNTFVIMQVHLLFVAIPDLYIYSRILHGSTEFPNYPMDQLRESIWTRYSYNSCLIGFVLGLAGSLMVAYALEKIRSCMKNKAV